MLTYRLFLIQSAPTLNPYLNGEKSKILLMRVAKLKAVKI